MCLSQLQFKVPGARRVKGARDKPVRHVHSCRKPLDQPGEKKNRIQDWSAKIDTVFISKMAKIDTLFMTKADEKPYPLRPHIPV